jgi:putative ABC transport system ATP-binding protein
MNSEKKFRRTNKNSKSNGRYRIQSSSLIDIRNVTKVYEGGGGSFTALRGITLEINEGEFVAVAGKSGSGKSTLLNMITGIDRPTSGEVNINGTPIHLLSEGKLAIWRGNNLGIVFQFFQLLPTLTVLENIMIPMDFCHKYSLKVRKERAMHLLEEVDLMEQANKLPSTLSGGQQQRVAIARALANDPPILVADEPTGNLDSKTAEGIFRLFHRLVDQGKTILMVTHDLELAKQLSRMIIISDGSITTDTKYRGFSESGIKEKEIINQTVDSNVNDLVKLIAEPSSEREVQTEINKDQQELQERIRTILLDQENSTQRLQAEFENASRNKELMQAVYSAVIEQAQLLAGQAESEQRIDDARKIWKTVMDAAKPWVKSR